MRPVLLSPHNDDAVLFASFTILRECPAVLTIFDSEKQRNAGIRRSEDEAAMSILGTDVKFLGGSDVNPEAALLELNLGGLFHPDTVVFAPAVEVDGHPHHNMVGEVARRLFKNVVSYMTYTRQGKSTGRPVPIENPYWPLKKLRALACYESQILRSEQFEHFLRDQREYYQ